MSFAVPTMMLRIFTAALIGVSFLAGPVAALCASCCPMPVAGALETSVAGAGCCGCDEVMTPAATANGIVPAKAFAAPSPASVPSAHASLRIAPGLRVVVRVSVPAARSAPTPRRL